MDERKGLARAAGEAVGAEGRNRGAGKGGLTGAFWALAAAQVVSLFGNAVLRFALPLHVLGVTGSSAVMGVVTACAWVPYIVLAPIGGVAADRIRKRLIMAALDAAMAAVCAAYLLLSGTADVVGLAVAALVALYAVQSIYQPTVQASVPALVGRAAIQRGTRSARLLSMLSSPGGAGARRAFVRRVRHRAPLSRCRASFSPASAVLVTVVVRVPFAPLPRDAGSYAHGGGRSRPLPLRFLREGHPAIFRMILPCDGVQPRAELVRRHRRAGRPSRRCWGSLPAHGACRGGARARRSYGRDCCGERSRAGSGSRLRPPSSLRGRLSLLPHCRSVRPFLCRPQVRTPSLWRGSSSPWRAARFSPCRRSPSCRGRRPDGLIGKVMALVMALANCATPVGALAYGWLLDVFRSGVPVVVLGVVIASLALSFAVHAVVRKGLKGDEK